MVVAPRKESEGSWLFIEIVLSIYKAGDHSMWSDVNLGVNSMG